MKRLSSLSTIAVVALAVFAASAAASHGKQYVLKHPNREHCKAHYAKKAETVKKREHHKTIKTKETVCVYVAPKEAPSKAPTTSTTSTTTPTSQPTTAPTPEPAKTSAPIKEPEPTKEPVKEPATSPEPTETTTTLNATQKGCNYLDSGVNESYKYCYYTLSAGVKVIGSSLTVDLVAPEVLFGFENEGNLQTIGIVNAIGSFIVEVATLSTDASSETRVREVAAATEKKGLDIKEAWNENTDTIETASGKEPWYVAAAYLGSSLYKESYSQTDTLSSIGPYPGEVYT